MIQSNDFEINYSSFGLFNMDSLALGTTKEILGGIATLPSLSGSGNAYRVQINTCNIYLLHVYVVKALS